MAKGIRVAVPVSTGAAVVLVPEGTIATVTNRDAAVSASLGGKTVATGQGYELKFGQSITVDARSEAVYAISDGAAIRVDVLAVRGVQV